MKGSIVLGPWRGVNALASEADRRLDLLVNAQTHHGNRGNHGNPSLADEDDLLLSFIDGEPSERQVVLFFNDLKPPQPLMPRGAPPPHYVENIVN